MEDIIKVSIAGVAFTLEKEAHIRLENYISSLEKHYAANPNADEIVNGIEERISEILSEKGYRGSVVPVSVVEELISILGSVEDLDEDYVIKDKPEVKRRIYRDVDNKLIGGVCSGWGAYFKADPIIFRLVFSLAVILSFAFESELFLLWIVIYILMWIITPAAVTSFQKCQMRGEENNIGSIQMGVESGSRAAEKSFEGTRKVLSKISRILAVFCGLVVVSVGLCGIFVTIVGSLGLTLIDAAIPFSAADFMTMVTNCSKWVSVLFVILAILVAALPAVALVYGGILLIFNLKSPKWRPGLVMFLLWFVSLAGFVSIMISYAANFPDNNSYYHKEKMTLSPNDTIFVEYVDCKKYNDYQVLVNGDKWEYNLFYANESGDSAMMVCYPHLEIHRSGKFIENPYLVSSSVVLQNGLSLNEVEEIRNGVFWSYSGKTLYLSPKIVEKGEAMTDILRRVALRVGPDVTIVVKEPVPHRFEDSFDLTDWKFKAVLELLD